MSARNLYKLAYHIGGEAITPRTSTALEFFYAENEAAARLEADRRKAQIEQESGLKVWEESLDGCTMGFTVTPRWFIPGHLG